MQKRVNRKGFTLVELVVVIAVLAILAGIGVVAYNGYIEKAREAADLELLGAVNTAFASACAEKGVEGLPDDAVATLVQKKVNKITVEGMDDLNDLFFDYFEGNEDKKFNVYEGLLYSKARGFYGSLNGGNTFIFNDGSKLTNKGTNADGNTTWTWEKNGKEYTITTNEEELEKFANSSYGKNMTMGSLLDEVNNVASAAADILKGNKIPVFFDMAKEELTPYLEKAGIYEGSPDYEKAVANAFVLGAADVLSGYHTRDDADTVEALYKVALGESLGGKNFTVDLDQMDGGIGMAAGYAFEYTVMTGFANSEVGQHTTIADPDDPSKQITLQEYHNRMSQELTGASSDEAKQILKDINTTLRGTDEFKSYMEEHGREDIEGMVAAMNSISNNSDTLAESGVLASGFGDDGVKDVLSAIFGG